MAIAGLFLFLGGCQKEDDNIKEISTSQKKFLNSSISDYSGISSHVLSATEIRSDEIITNIKGIKSKLLELDRSNGLFTKIIHRYGYPIWDQILVSENSNLKFVYFFPILKPYKDLTNGFLKVSMKLNGQIIMHFVDENDVILAIQNDRFSDLTLQYASIKYKFDTDLFSKRNDGLQIFINYFIESNDQRLTPRNTCWDDVVITFYSDEYTSSSTGWHTLYDVNGTVNNTTFSPIRHVIPGGRKFTISTFNPDCFDSGQGDVIIYPPDLSGGTSISYSSYFAKVEKNLIFVNACMNNTQNIPVADDSHNNPAGESWLWSPEDVKKCTLIKQLSACGLSESYVAKYLSAYETGVFTEIVKNFSTNQFCGSPFLDDALYNYFLLVESQLSSVYLTSNVSFSSYINSYITIQTFLNSHNNDQISTQIGNHFLNILNSNLSNPGSGNTLTLEYLNLLYLHETLKSNYPDYNSANVNIDVFIATYGAEKYIAATTLYTKMRMNGMNVSWIDIEARFQNWYIDNIDSGQEYSISGGFDWSKHSPVTSQSLLSYSGFFNAYPKQNGELLEGAANIFNLLNGPIRDLFDDYPNLRNVCALKVSIALNGAGVDIPFIFQDDNSNGIKEVSESSFTIPDDNGNYYFLNAELLIKYMLEVFPTPSVTVNGDDLQNGATPETSFGLNNGIYGMLPLDVNYFGASGHCDIWLPKSGSSPVYNECGAGCHWGFVDVAYLWILN